MKKTTIFLVTMIFLLNPLLISMSDAAAEAVPFMTKSDGTVVSITPEQLSALVAQPGITISPTAPSVGEKEIAIPIPEALGGGYLVGTPSAIASALGATGIAPGMTASDVLKSTASAGVLLAGALAGAATGLGTAGTAAAGAAVAGGALAIILSTSGGGGGTSQGGGTPQHQPSGHK
jgi:hypothetical protein